ncbi:hypothetical protein C2G38_2100950 [Gigaspora rosea]|uniref:Uncharacterized protein n=1 Tax=Gigaspora rosea TaxID=44941 RepID=A0A397US68_9GLOM|nr:hypothetical protein C2G38_2100950 [Gigaspora rosea]
MLQGFFVIVKHKIHISSTWISVKEFIESLILIIIKLLLFFSFCRMFGFYCILSLFLICVILPFNKSVFTKSSTQISV